MWVQVPPSALMWQILVGTVGLLVYLYLTWRVLRNNYKEEDVAAFGWISLLTYLLGSRLAYGFVYWGVWAENPIKWLEFWKMGESNVIGGYLFWISMVWLVATDRGWKFFSLAEDNLWLLLWLNGVYFTVSEKWLPVLLLFLVALISRWLKGRYRSFVWYKSGRKGFLYLTANIIIFLGMSLIYSNIYYIIPALICGVELGILGGERNS
ncbi:hypothetical protein COS78_00530 [Candidatus Shapirobacteria bacterium CG06_land_8_20_14_3_00_40_12]|uniref:Prolipoprotein diacylglyceryl transferase n=2 Tax=Candidatus Shapironibacteriota TaxID=1752721 RepID=A0A2M7TTW4_9BACT|nr:MAG: hypothetical protein COS78_00530 [Candidatus Shapirobacteria bacterium CG06_land_8_20_14_3_00_40_12]PIZ60513.1 MAG: hypothetical protein COY20_01125 [Candidatus Shapirobacteria bacterium CG_4_10_14_0_2_um_filter_40_12]